MKHFFDSTRTVLSTLLAAAALCWAAGEPRAQEEDDEEWPIEGGGPYIDCTVSGVPQSGAFAGQRLEYRWPPIDLSRDTQPLQFYVTVGQSFVASAVLAQTAPLTWSGTTVQTGTPVRVAVNRETMKARVKHGPFDFTGNCAPFEPVIEVPEQGGQ
jgi:hypothetical protein